MDNLQIIQRRLYVIRRQCVMLDRDLGEETMIMDRKKKQYYLGFGK